MARSASILLRILTVVLALGIRAAFPAEESDDLQYLDPTFGSAGAAFADFGNGSGDRALAVAIAGDGKILVAGAAGFDGGIARFAADGTPDPAFGSGGVVTVPVFLFASFDAVAAQSDGKVVAAGTVSDGGSGDFLLVRLNTDGSFDATFGSGGVVQTDLAGGSHEGARAMALQADGKIVLAGFSGLNPFRFVVVRYDTDGSLDPTFGTGGVTITAFPDGSTIGNAVAIQPDGKILVAGELYIDDNHRRFALARYGADGQLDPGFGAGGLVTTEVVRKPPSGVSWAVAQTLALQPDGKILAAGWAARFGLRLHFAVTRYAPDGTLDRRFGRRGIRTTSFLRSTEAQVSIVYALSVLADGRIVAAGDGYYEPALAGYRSTGRRDPRFGHRGIITPDVPVRVLAAAVQADGRIVLAGDAIDEDHTGFGLLRVIP